MSELKKLAILLHPHPIHGGNMTSMVPGELFSKLPKYSIAALRFNFRGIGSSEGHFDHGRGEALDTIAAINYCSDRFKGASIAIVGSSFGADVALTVSDERISRWCAIAPPLRDDNVRHMHEVAKCEKPKLFVLAQRDKICSPETAIEKIKEWNNCSYQTVSGVDHFFVGKLNVAIDAAIKFIAN